MQCNRWRLTWGTFLFILFPPTPAAAEEPHQIHGAGITPPEATTASVYGILEIRRIDDANHQIRVRLTDVHSNTPVREAVVRLEITQIEHSDPGHGGGMGMMGMGHYGHGESHSHGETGELMHLSTFALKGEEAGLYVSTYRADTSGRYRITATIEMANGQVLSPPVQISTVYEVPKSGQRRWGHTLGYGIVGGVVMLTMMAAIMSRAW
ncbi:MAG: hypothetical protein HY709_05590 [Candidatus Latescibacteria bacterium]|nr:hypothetical protein [Candidatus Latescibacterota bacterium]